MREYSLLVLWVRKYTTRIMSGDYACQVRRSPDEPDLGPSHCLPHTCRNWKLKFDSEFVRFFLFQQRSHLFAGTSTYTVLQFVQSAKRSEFGLLFYKRKKNHAYCKMPLPWQLEIFFLDLSESYGGYDWGSEEKNLLHHGSPQPPSYSLKNVTAKVRKISVLVDYS